ncbi:MAG: TatD family hydrolase [Fervidicoccus fontis]
MNEEKLIFSDSHAHNNPIKGIGAKKIAEKFRENNGWFIAFLNNPAWDYSDSYIFDVDEYLKLVNLHMRDCKSATETGLKVKCFAGIHPAEIDKLAEYGLPTLKVRDFALKTIEKIFDMCKEGLLDGIGEIGRQHYKIRMDVAIITQEILESSFTFAKDYGCKIQLHLENIKGFTVENIASLAYKTGLKSDQFLIHHATSSIVEEAKNRRVWTTYPGIIEGLKSLFTTIRNPEYVLIESDYVDSKKEGGRITYPWNLPDIQLSLLEKGDVSKYFLEKINIDNVESFFDVKY